jgi:hypothetical protein
MTNDIETPSCAPESRCIVFDCQTADDLAMINKGSTNENNTDVEPWADARRLRINGKPFRNHGVASTSRPALQDCGNGIAVDTICACP